MFEENGPARDPFFGGFGLLAPGGIKKPSFYAFTLFHRLGNTRIANSAENALVTRGDQGSFVIALWNLSPPNQPASSRTYDLSFVGPKSAKHLLLWRIDAEHSNTLAAYARLGKPRYPTEKQVRQLNDESSLTPPEAFTLKNGHFLLTLPVNGFALLEVRR